MPHEPARQVGKDPARLDRPKGDTQSVRGTDLNPISGTYPDIPIDEPGLMGGPAVEAVPGSHRDEDRYDASIINPPPGEADDGGESILSGRPRETGGERPPKRIPKTEGS